MKVDDVLNGYRITTPPTNAGGGMSQWSFAERDGKEYFVKMFLSPKFPLDTGPGSAAAKERKRQVCLGFEQRHLSIAERLDPGAPGAGNLVIPCDFFRVESTYVKVAERVQVTELPHAVDLNSRQILVVLRTLLYSLRMLHERAIVHGDLKPDNVLAQRGGEDLFVSKLIDFDEAYLAGNPPPADQIVGDPLYYSPELLRYIKGDPSMPAAQLTTASDVFSLGLLLHSYLVGDVPNFDRLEANYPCEAVNNGLSLDVSAAPAVMHETLRRMLLIDPLQRPQIGELIDILATIAPESIAVTTRVAPSARPRPSLVGARPESARAPAPAPAPASVPAPAFGTLAHAPGTSGSSPAGAGPDSSGLRSTMGRRKRPE